MDDNFYTALLYPLQDEVLRTLIPLRTGFYLTGGTAASRGYLHHRYSDDLDFFVNDDDRFSLWVEQIAETFAKEKSWQMEIVLRGERYAGFVIQRAEVSLKIDLVNDVPSRVGEIVVHPVLGPIDSAENILANKITALVDRKEPKDLADVWGFCTKMQLSLSDAIENARGKAAGIFPPDLARVLCSATRADWELIRWADPPPPDVFVQDLFRLGEQLLLGE